MMQTIKSAYQKDLWALSFGVGGSGFWAVSPTAPNPEPRAKIYFDRGSKYGAAVNLGSVGRRRWFVSALRMFLTSTEKNCTITTMIYGGW